MLLTTLSLLLLSVVGVLSHSSPLLSEQDASAVYPPLIENIRGTYLYGYDGCNRIQRSAINEAYDDFKTLSNQEMVKSDIDFNSAAALEYLGPPGLNIDQRSQIQAVFANAATVYPGSILNPFKLYIRVRCNDPFERCPCGTGTLTAYARNKDPEDSRYPFVNFCPRFFNIRSLKAAIAFGSGQAGLDKFILDKYANRASIMFHELLHLDLVADSENGNPNPAVTDMQITYSYQNENGQTVFMHVGAYGPERCKLMTRFRPTEDDYPTGFYIQRNADNLQLFALAVYVQSKINAYPHLPIITGYTLVGPPFPKVPTKAESAFGNNTLLMAGSALLPE